VPELPLPTVAPAASAFVSRSGTNLMLDGHVWQFVGYDDYRLTSELPGFMCGDNTSDAEVASILTEIHDNSGATVIRVPFEQTYGGPGNWTQLDRVLTVAASLGMRVVPVLADEYGACDTFAGQPQLNKTLSWYQAGYKQPTPGATLSYRDFAVAIATHYADDPTIAFWQLMNEASDSTSVNPETCDEQEAAVALRAFADDVAGAMKAVDPNHLINLGTIGSGQCGASGSADYQYVHAGLIDICEVHDYGSIAAIPGDQWNGIQTRINDCHADGKPIWAGEEGLDASLQPNGTTSGVVTPASLALRAATFTAKMQAQFAQGLAGFVVWEFNPSAADTGWTITPGDPTEGALAAEAAALRAQNGV